MAVPSLTLRNVKGSPITFGEMDENLTNLQNATIGITTGSNAGSLSLNDTLTITGGTGIAVALNTGTQTLTITNTVSANTATATTLGQVKIGANITAASDGTISVAAPYTLNTATNSTLG